MKSLMTDAFPFCTDIMNVLCKFLITVTARQPDIVQVHYTNAHTHMMQYVRPLAFTVVNFLKFNASMLFTQKHNFRVLNANFHALHNKVLQAIRSIKISFSLS